MIRTHPQVRDVAVVGRPAADVGEEPVAPVAVRAPSEFSETALMAYCRQKLAGNKSPAEIFVVKELPRALAGMINRAALPELLRLMTSNTASGDRASGQG